MKNRKAPKAVAQKFVDNEYAAACYKVYCMASNDNGWYDQLFDETNRDGVYSGNLDHS